MDLEKLTKLVYEVNAENKRLLGIIQAIEKEVYPKLAALSKDVNALESTVNQPKTSSSGSGGLEARLENLENVIEVKSNKLTIKSPGDLTIKSPLKLTLEGGVATTLKGAHVTVESNGLMKLDGLPIKLNGGTKAAARVGSLVDSNSNKILQGAPDVYLP